MFEHRFESGQVEHGRNRPAGGSVAGSAEAQQGGPFAVAPLVDIGRLDERTQPVPDAARLEDAADLVIEVHRSGHRIGNRPAFQHDDRMPALGEQDGEDIARRTEPDDRHLGVESSTPHGRAHGWRRG